MDRHAGFGKEARIVQYLRIVGARQSPVFGGVHDFQIEIYVIQVGQKLQEMFPSCKSVGLDRRVQPDVFACLQELQRELKLRCRLAAGKRDTAS